MEWTGELIGITQDYETGKFRATFEINEGVPVVNFLQNLFRTKLSISAKKYRQKRSLDANAYCWVLMSKIAELHDTSKDEVYEEMLQKYGYFYKDDNGYITVTVKSEVDMSKINGHWKFYKGNGQFSSYLMIKGSSEYDSKEMANFIDRIVDEAKEQGIQTETPNEIARMKAMWGTANG